MLWLKWSDFRHVARLPIFGERGTATLDFRLLHLIDADIGPSPSHLPSRL